MNPFAKRADLPPPPAAEDEPLELTSADFAIQPGFDHGQWAEQQSEAQGAGGRQVLGAGLSILAALWLAFTAWSAGRALAGQPLTSPALAQWVAVAAGPLALLGLVWLMFGRTRRKEAERFTRSVVTMRSEAQSLEALLEVLMQRINDSRAELGMISQHLMQLGDEATTKLGGITREFDSSSERLLQHGSALDRAAESARTDIAVLLDDLPRAEATARTVAEHLRAMGGHAAQHAQDFDGRVQSLTSGAQAAETALAAASARLAEQLASIENAGATAAQRVSDAENAFAGSLDALLGRTATTLEEIRGGVSAQSAAVSALVEQASAGIGKAGADASEALAANVDHANRSLGELSAQVASQQQASQMMLAEIERGLALIDQRFGELSAQGDERASHFLESLSRARGELDALAALAGGQNDAIASLAERTEGLRASVGQLADDIRDNVGTALGEAQGGTDRLNEAAQSAKPEIGWMRDAAVEASDRIAATAASIAQQQDDLAALLGRIDDGVDGASGRLGELSTAIGRAQAEAQGLTAETGPALVSALLQVKDAAAHAAERAREAIEAVIPASAGRLSDEARAALEAVLRETIGEQLSQVEAKAAQAVDAARAASERLTGQLLTLGQSASALEQHLAETSEAQRERDSEAFARRVALLIDSMHSASIDVGKILSDEHDDKAWAQYMKGDRGVFTRRAARLIRNSETRAIAAHYESDGEFQRSANRFIHDFEAMLRRVTAERDGGSMAVTLMSSDVGKLYAALAEAISVRA